MANTKHIEFPYGLSGRTVYYKCQQLNIFGLPYAPALWLDDNDGTFKAVPVDDTIDMAESGTVVGVYVDDENRSVWTNGIYYFYFYDNATGALVGEGIMHIYDDVDFDHLGVVRKTISDQHKVITEMVEASTFPAVAKL